MQATSHGRTVTRRMVTQIHTLRNTLAKALLMATAMVDGKLRPNKSNLQALAQTLDEVNAIVRRVPKYDLEEGGEHERLVDVRKMVDSVVRELELVSTAAACCAAERARSMVRSKVRRARC